MFLKNNKTAAIDTSANTANAKKSTPTVISAGTNILGNIVSDVVVDIDGSVEGNVKSEQVNVRANGKIAGDIIANAVHVYGEVNGLVKAHAVHLYSSARVTGVIVHQALTVEDGAFLDAKFKRMDKTDPAAEILKTSDEEDTEGLIESSPFTGPNKLRLIG